MRPGALIKGYKNKLFRQKPKTKEIFKGGSRKKYKSSIRKQYYLIIIHKTKIKRKATII